MGERGQHLALMGIRVRVCICFIGMIWELTAFLLLGRIFSSLFLQRHLLEKMEHYSKFRKLAFAIYLVFRDLRERIWDFSSRDIGIKFAHQIYISQKCDLSRNGLAGALENGYKQVHRSTVTSVVCLWLEGD